MTTGATLNECASVIKQAGAKTVYAFVIAVAGQKIDS
jgi:predicted amidophosphoribosyltransferase